MVPFQRRHFKFSDLFVGGMLSDRLIDEHFSTGNYILDWTATNDDVLSNHSNSTYSAFGFKNLDLPRRHLHSRGNALYSTSDELASQYSSHFQNNLSSNFNNNKNNNNNNNNGASYRVLLKSE